MIARIGRRHEEANVLSYDLRRAVAKNSLGGAVERIDDSMFIDGDDAVDGSVERRLKSRIRLGELGLRSLEIGQTLEETIMVV